ncbi:MAG TPA: hypothetical protein VKU41_11155 [Polyangiaceae bacterium]|nr:hypothetical protein [Polyangiaceae bacterium]
MDRLHALLILAWALVRSLVAPVFGGRRGLLDFQRSYAADRVPPVSADERAVIGAASRCIACGRCDVGEGARIVRSGGVYAGVMDLMVSASRGMPDFDAAARSFAAVDDARLGELEPLCPARVPMRRVAAFVRSKSAGSSEARVRTTHPTKAESGGS